MPKVKAVWFAILIERNHLACPAHSVTIADDRRKGQLFCKRDTVCAIRPSPSWFQTCLRERFHGCHDCPPPASGREPARCPASRDHRPFGAGDRGTEGASGDGVRQYP